MHQAAYHFIKALGVLSLMKTKRKLTQKAGAKDDKGVGVEDDEADDEDEAIIDVSMDIEASADDAEAMAATTVVDYDSGDTLGKLLALVNQVQMSSNGVREFLAHACNLHSIKPIELLLGFGHGGEVFLTVLRQHLMCKRYVKPYIPWIIV